MSNHGTIKYRVGQQTRVIGLSERSEVKYGNRMWTVFIGDQKFVTFKASDLISGFNHLTSKFKLDKE